MKITFDNINNLTLIDHIMSLDEHVKNSKLNIKISFGLVYRIVKDRIFVVNNKNIYYNIGIENLKKEDLIIILRYLQNMEKCREIVIDKVSYGDSYDSKTKTWRKVISNKREVDKHVKEYLSKKKNIAKIDLRSNVVTANVKLIGKLIKNRVDDLKKEFSKHGEVYYDINGKKFIIVVDKCDESQFGVNLIHLISDIKDRYRYDCVCLSFGDYVKSYNKINYRLIYF